MSEPDGADEGTHIRIILDASALTAFGQHETVGEIIGEINNEEHGAAFATTTAALAEAIARGADRVLLDILRTNTNCVLVASTTEWDELGRFMDLTRPAPDALHDLADSDLTLLAVRTRAYILTDHPTRYTTIVASVVTIQLEEPWSD